MVNNYTGDRMAFEMGQEMAEAEGITVGTLFIDDDVAVKDSTYTVGRRGVAGNFFVIKAVGAAAEQGADLDELVRIGEKVNSRHPHHGHGADRRARRRPRARRCSSSATTRWRWASASTASRAAAARSWPARTRSSTSCSRPSCSDLPFTVRRRRGADDQRPRRHPDQRAVPALRARPRAAGRARHQRRPQLRRRVLHVAGHGGRARSPWSSWTTRSIGLLAAPAEIAIRTF